MKNLARWAVLGMAAVAACATLPSFADGEGTATVENDILTLSGLVTNITAEADLGTSVTQVVMTAEGGVAFGASVTAAKNYKLNGTGIVSVAEGKRFSVTAKLLSTIGHTLVKDGPGTLYFSDSTSAIGKVPTPTRWVVKEGELRIRNSGSFYGNHSSTTTNLTLELREGTTYYQEQGGTAITHNPMGPIEMTGARFVWGPTLYANTTTREGACAFKGGVIVHASETPSYMTWPRYSHLNHCNPDCVFNIEAGGKLIVDGVLTNGATRRRRAGSPAPQRLDGRHGLRGGHDHGVPSRGTREIHAHHRGRRDDQRPDRRHVRLPDACDGRHAYPYRHGRRRVRAARLRPRRVDHCQQHGGQRLPDHGQHASPRGRHGHVEPCV